MHMMARSHLSKRFEMLWLSLFCIFFLGVGGNLDQQAFWTNLRLYVPSPRSNMITSQTPASSPAAAAASRAPGSAAASSSSGAAASIGGSPSSHLPVLLLASALPLPLFG